LNVYKGTEQGTKAFSIDGNCSVDVNPIVRKIKIVWTRLACVSCNLQKGDFWSYSDFTSWEVMVEPGQTISLKIVEMDDKNNSLEYEKVKT